MTKYRDTRTYRARELLKTINRGPTFSSCFTTGEYSTQHAKEDYQLWVQTWCVPELKQLMPELRDKSKEVIHAKRKTKTMES